VACTESVATPRAAAIIDAALDRFGRMDALIHNAGNVRRAPLAQMTTKTSTLSSTCTCAARSTWCARRSRMRRRLRPDRADLLDRRAVRKPDVANYAAKAGIIGLSMSSHWRARHTTSPAT
jgi:NAD(P)-dependent dehydrogenase (short-subunit alcohol dehydrogenase family)